MTDLEPRMGAFSAVMWDIEVDPVLRSPITLVCMLDSVPDADVVLDRVERMTRANAKLRARVIGNPVSLVPPRWEVDPNFDIAYHVRWARPERARADLSDVLEMAERVTEEDFDRSRPLWELTIVTGLKGKQAAFIMKVHHSITDGEGGVMMLATLLELQREPADLGEMPPAPTGEVLDHSARFQQGVVTEAKTVVSDARTVAGGSLSLAKKAITDPMSSAVTARNWTASAARLLAPAAEPLSDLWRDRSMSVAFAVLEAPLSDLKAAAKTAGVTLNDAYMAAVMGGLWRYHKSHGSASQSLRVNMPVSLRTSGDGDAGGNSWVPARFEIPIGDVDPEQRMKDLHPLLLAARTEPALGMSSGVYKVMSLLPNPAMAAASAGLMKGTDFAATNVPGPPIPLFFAGAEILSMVPFAPKGGAAVNIGLMSYAGSVFIGINIDRGAVPDPDTLTDDLFEALQEVLAVGAAPPEPTA